MEQPSHHDVSSSTASWTAADFVGGHPVLDLVNTVADTGKSRQTTRLRQWKDFASWQVVAGRVHASDFDLVVDVEPSRQRRVLGRIHALREQAFLLLSSVARDDVVERETLAALERAIASATGRASLHVDRAGGIWQPSVEPSHHHVDRFALRLDELLRSGDAGRLRECGRCTWLFLDRGRGAGRRWCDMRTCGNRAKASAFRERS